MGDVSPRDSQVKGRRGRIPGIHRTRSFHWSITPTAFADTLRVPAADAACRFGLYGIDLSKMKDRLDSAKYQFSSLLVFDEVTKLLRDFGTEAEFKYKTERDTLLNKIHATTRK